MISDGTALQRRFGAWEDCPHEIFDALATVTTGDFDERIASLITWRTELLAGRVPAPLPTWPPSWVAAPFVSVLTHLGLQRFCREQPTLVDELLLDLIAESERRAAIRRARIAAQIAEELAARAALRRKFASRGRRRESLDGEHIERGVDRELMAEAWCADRWRERVRVWLEIEKTFGELGRVLGLGWDLSRGVLRHVGFDRLARLRDVVARLPELRDVIRMLGRLQPSAESTSSIEDVVAVLRRVPVPVRTPLVVAEARGIDRGGEIDRMLPSEAMLIRRPLLRRVWQARLIERQLTTFLIDGLDTDEREVVQTEARRRQHDERGPILILIDTSGSMAGAPEIVAKAIALEAMRVAHRDGRRCILMSWSGPGQIAERELALTPGGVGALLDFLATSFSGGTDPEGPLRRALSRVTEEAWRAADVMMVSDGEFPVRSNLVEEIRVARERYGLRVVGACLGDSSAMRSVCEPCFAVESWLRGV